MMYNLSVENAVRSGQTVDEKRGKNKKTTNKIDIEF